MQARTNTVDEYLATVSDEKRTALEKLRKTIRSIVPDAEECISYRILALRLGGKVVAGFCARADGCSYFPFSGRTLRTLAEDFAGCKKMKSALHFDPEAGLSTSHVERQNLTVRMQIRRMTRLTNAFSKKLRNHRAATALHFANYNFARIHWTLRATPAMAAGVTSNVWSMGDLLDAALYGVRS